MRIGLLVNPIAGMGGSVGLKGTDGNSILREAESRGAKRSAPGRARIALESLKGLTFPMVFVTCAGEMGEEELDAVGMKAEVAHIPRRPTTSEDTRTAARRFIEKGVDIIVFVGGDGTARDLVEVVDRTVPVIGIPAGVKMHSGVFIHSPDLLSSLLSSFASTGATRDAEVTDVDEDKFRQGELSSKLVGIALVPDDNLHIQAGKASYIGGSASDESTEIGAYLAEAMKHDVLYLLGPGSTTEAIAKALGQPKTLLGVDILLNGLVVASDVSEREILAMMSGSSRRAAVIVSPIGAQGFVFGRGNQQISPEVLRTVDLDDIIVVATPTKLRHTPVLRVDTGDKTLDEELRGKWKVITGYRRRTLVEIM